MIQGLVSVIMPTYNTGARLKHSIDSVLRQTYQNFELLITDDNSDDNLTLDILRSYALKDNRVKVFYHKQNDGAGAARNNSIYQALGQYIAFCDSDDRWAPDKLDKQVAFMQQNGHCLVFSSYFVCGKHGNVNGIVIAPAKVSFSMLMRDNKIGCLTAIYDASIYGKFYFPNIRKRQDWGLFLNMLSVCHYAYSLPQPLAFYNKCGESLSSNKFSLVKYNINIYRNILGFPLPKALLYFLFIFLPSYCLKVLKVNIDSFFFRRQFLLDIPR